MNDTLLWLVYDRLDRDAAVDEPWAELVMAACEGEAAVEAVLDEQHAAAPLPAPAATASDPPGVFLQPHGKPRTTLEEIGWAEVLGTYRPFLSYNELGSMLDEGPSKLYDALARVLGLDDLVEADAALATARKSRQGAVKQVKDLAGALQTRIRTLADGSPDDRLARALALRKPASGPRRARRANRRFGRG